MNGDEDDVRPASSRIRLRFSLLALLIFITLVSLLLAWLVQPQRVVATALFEVESMPPAIFGDAGNPLASEREFEITRKTQLARLKSNYVLTAAVRNPAIASLGVFHGQSDPVDWLQDHLKVSFPENSEILSISLSGTKAQSQDLVRVIDAVAKAYKDEVISATRQQRLASRDLLNRNLENLNADIKRQMDEFLEIARESGRTESGSGRLFQELDLKRLDRIEEELMRLESEQASKPGEVAVTSKSIQERINQLRERQTELEKKLASQAERSSDLEIRQRQLEQLQKIANEMSVKLEQLDIEASSPDRIRQVQAAVISQE